MRLAALLLCGVTTLQACAGSLAAPSPRQPEQHGGVTAVEKSDDQSGSRLLPWLVFVGSAAATVAAVLAILSTQTWEGHG